MTSSGDAIALGVRRGEFGGTEAVVVEWDFAVHGGTFGHAEADAFVSACTEAIRTATPLVTIVRSGGTRLQEGMTALVGIPRAALALRDLASAGVPHLSVAAHPTTGGVWVAICSQADLRLGVAGATVGFSGPRVIEAMTGVRVPPGANTAESALAAGLLDDVVPADGVEGWLSRALRAVRPAEASGDDEVAPPDPPTRSAWEQVRLSREASRPSGQQLALALLDEPVSLRAADETVAAAVGHIGPHSAVVVAVAGPRAGHPSPAGFRLLCRAAGLSSRLGLPLVTLIDSAGADPLPPSEDAGIAPAIGDALSAVLDSAAPTVAIVHGEGGSGGALAAAVCDVVAVTETGWFAALAPEGAAAALRRTPADAAELMRVRPADLLADGFADTMAPSDPAALRGWLRGAISAAVATDPDVRRAARERRWRAGLSASNRND